MKILFMGSGPFACPAVTALRGRSGDDLVAVVTQPDRPGGRNRELRACPAKELAAAAGVPVLTPERIGDPAAVAQVEALAPDLAVVADYGQYIPSRLLRLPPLGMINIHPSLLPKYRGAAPIPWAVANGDEVTGVTILHVSPRMDAGDIILQREHPIGPDDTGAGLEPRLAAAGAALLLEAIDLLRAGRAPRMPQDEARATHARKLEKADGRLDWSLPAAALRNRIRAFQPWPGAFCEAPAGSGRLLKVLRAAVEPGVAARPGELVECHADQGPLVACGRDGLRLLEVQPEGKRPMPGCAWLCGCRLLPGMQLG